MLKRMQTLHLQRRNCNHRHAFFAAHQRGVGLIEVMVAIVLLAIGLLGAVALQFATAKEQRSSQYIVRAAHLGNEIAERMRANRAGVEAGLYNMAANNTHSYATSNQAIAASSAMPAPTCNPLPACATAAWVAQADTVSWHQATSANLPQAAAIVLPVQGTMMLNAHDIVIAWVEPALDKDANGTRILLRQALNNNGCPPIIAAPDGVRCYQTRFVL